MEREALEITFLTLFLGLVSGMARVDLAVQGPAAPPSVIELLLDGRRVERIEAPPWSAAVDLGPLEPRELVVRALAPDGAELASAKQLLNVPRPAAEVEVALERGADGRPAAARLSWESLVGREPEAIAVTFDGKPLPVSGNRAALPAYDPEVTHLLSAELQFSRGVSARRDLVLGGLYGSEVRTELTAVPVRVPKRWQAPPPARLAGWLEAHGRPLQAVAVEEGPAQVIVVRDPEPWKALRQLGSSEAGPTSWSPRSVGGSAPMAPEDPAFGPATRVRFLWPAGRPQSGVAVPIELFDASRDFTADNGGFKWLLTRVEYPLAVGGPRRFADAVAVAGLQAAAGNRRRAVVLVLQEGEDASRHEPAAVRRYLEAIGVPLHVWSLVELRKLPPALAAWGEVQDVSSPAGLRRAAARLRDDVATQRIVWIDGRHLPQSVRTTAAAGVTKIGR